MGVYSTYIALNALAPVRIPDDIRQSVEGVLITMRAFIVYELILGVRCRSALLLLCKGTDHFCQVYVLLMDNNYAGAILMYSLFPSCISEHMSRRWNCQSNLL